MAFLAIVAVALIVFAVKTIRDDKRKERTTACVSGTIHGTDLYFDREERTTTYYWLVRYTAGKTEYELKQEALMTGGEKMLEHKGEQVTVCYDPEDPRTAWAETPGKHACTNSKAGESGQRRA